MKLPVLVSYAYWNNDMLDMIKQNREHLTVLIDSGAYTAFTKGKEVNIDKYMEFLDYLGDDYDEAIQLDVLDNPKATRENYEVLLTSGYDTLPVFTRGESVENLLQMPKRFCIGGLPNNTRSMWPYLEWIFNNMQEREPHILGFTNAGIFAANNPPKSIDSSSWSIGFRLGKVKIGDFVIDYELTRNPAHKDYGRARHYLNSIGIHIEEMRDRAEWKHSEGTLLNDLVYRTAVLYSMKVQTQYPGKQYYCAFSTGTQLCNLIKAFKMLNKDAK